MTTSTPPQLTPRQISARMRRILAERPYLRLVASGGKTVGFAPGERLAEHCSEQDRRAFYWRMVDAAVANGYKLGWAAHRYREQFGDWPPERFKMP